jgi:hypothetical protein
MTMQGGACCKKYVARHIPSFRHCERPQGTWQSSCSLAICFGISVYTLAFLTSEALASWIAMSLRFSQ